MRDQLELRAPREAVAPCLIRRLVVPRIYVDAQWPDDSGATYDLVAIDRDGGGDAHLVQIRRVASEALAQVPMLLGADAPYRWVAFLKGTEDGAAALSLLNQDALYTRGKAGRVGVIEIVEMASNQLGANVLVTAERFPGSFYDLSTAFSGSHHADVQF